MSMSEAAVHVKMEDRPGDARIARVTVDNVRKLNCLSTTAIVAVARDFQSARRGRPVRAVVFTGPVSAPLSAAPTSTSWAACAPTARGCSSRGSSSVQGDPQCPAPVIGRINGFCLGAGLEVAACCDMRAAAEGAQLGMPEVHMGIPSVIEAALLPGLIGWGRTREMLLTGVLYSAREALDMGLVQKVAPLSERMPPLCRGSRAYSALHRRRCARKGADGALGEDIDRRGHLRRHRRVVGCLQDRRAAGRHRAFFGRKKRG